MANQGLLWKAVEHSGTKAKGKHVVLVAYRPELAVTRRNKVIAFAPMYDLRVANMDGSTSFGEKLAPWMVTPFGVGDPGRDRAERNVQERPGTAP